MAIEGLRFNFSVFLQTWIGFRFDTGSAAEISFVFEKFSGEAFQTLM